MTRQEPMSLPLWNELGESLEGKELEELQLAKLKSLLVRVYEKSPYYRDKFDKAGVNPHNFTSLEQYLDYPFFTKNEERESQARSLEEDGHPLGKHITCDISAVNRMSASSGTTGVPSFQGHTANDRKIHNENYARMFARLGLKPGDRGLFAGVISMWVAGLPTLDGMLSYGINTIPLGALVGSLKVAEMARLTRPRLIIGTPSFLRHVLRKARAETDIDLTSVGIEKILVYGEPGGSLPEVISELSKGFGGAQVYDLMGGTGCMNPIFISCEAEDGLHFIAPDHAYIEMRDPATGKMIPIEDGAEGEFVYTGFDRECSPLVRFCDGDLMHVKTAPCSCGRPGWRIKVVGRVDDMMLVKGVNVYPTAIQTCVLKHKPKLTGNIRILKYSDGPVVEPPLELWAECAGKPSKTEQDEIKARLESEIKRVLRFSANVTLFAEDEMEMEYGATNKAKLIKKMY
ncbi:MAG: hypothetical protein KDJ90_17075 [Nitratireductor sp.]|nr:hypothetical protein [Nitratireductor sp.]